jgi:hypothetical protein
MLKTSTPLVCCPTIKYFFTLKRTAVYFFRRVGVQLYVPEGNICVQSLHGVIPCLKNWSKILYIIHSEMFAF